MVNVSAKLRPNLEYIANFLKRAEYSDIGCLASEYIDRLLLEPSDARQQLLLRLVRQLLPLQASPDSDYWSTTGQSAISRAVTALCSLGVCRPSDTAVVAGTAPADQQVRMWVTLVECVTACERLDRTGQDVHRVQQRTDSLLHALTASGALALTNRGEASSVLPDDLKNKYDLYCRQGKQLQRGPLQLAITIDYVQQQLEQTKLQYQQISEEFSRVPSFTESREAVEETAGSLQRVAAAGQLFTQVHSQHFAPWQSQHSKHQQTELPDTGAVVSEAHLALQQLNQALSTASSLADRALELQATETAALATLHDPASLTVNVHRLASQIAL